MRKKRLLIILLFSIPLLLIGYYFLNLALNKLSGYLSKSEQINANILIVEGWLPEDAIENAFCEFKKNGYEYIITTGVKSDGEYYRVSMNGCLIFFPKNRFSLFNKSDRHIIEIPAYSEMGGKNRAHFNVFINDSLVSDFLAVKKKRNYLIQWEGKLAKIDSIMVMFDNDDYKEFVDRNLYVKEIIIDHKIIIPVINNSIYDISDAHVKGRVINNFNSNAQLTKNKLFSMGIDSSIIKALPGRKTRLNRTLTSALAVSNWLETSNLKVKGINIVSVGTHARRTWMTYNKVLNKSYDVGIISLKDKENSFSGKIRFVNTLRETIAILYYWFILIPY